jgi:hypothetical protein
MDNIHVVLFRVQLTSSLCHVLVGCLVLSEYLYQAALKFTSGFRIRIFAAL